MAKGDYRFRINTGWSKDKDISIVLGAVQGHFDKLFTTKCVTILHAVFKPLAVALRTNSAAEVRKAIELSRDKVETFYDLALMLVSADESTSEATTLASGSLARSQVQPALAESKAVHLPPSSPRAIEPEIVYPPIEPYDPPREAEEPPVVDSGSPAPSIYAGFEPDE